MKQPQSDAADRLTTALRDVINEAVDRAVVAALAGKAPIIEAPADDRLQVTIKEAGRLLSVDVRTVRRLIDTGELQAAGHGQGKRVLVASLRRYADRGK